MYEYTEIEILERVADAMDKRPDQVPEEEEWNYPVPLTYRLEMDGSYKGDKVVIHYAEIIRVPESTDSGEIFVEVFENLPDGSVRMRESETFYIDDDKSGIVEIGGFILARFHEILNERD